MLLELQCIELCTFDNAGVTQYINIILRRPVVKKETRGVMTTQNNNGQEREKIIAFYCRLSVDDDKKDMESNSITNQKQTLLVDGKNPCTYCLFSLNR